MEFFVTVSSGSLGSFTMYIMSNPNPIKGYVRHHFPLFLFYSLSKMEATIDIEFLQGNKEQVIKESAIVDGGVVQTYLFRPPYHLEPHGSRENGLNWADGNIPYDQLRTILREAAAPYDHLYA